MEHAALKKRLTCEQKRLHLMSKKPNWWLLKKGLVLVVVCLGLVFFFDIFFFNWSDFFCRLITAKNTSFFGVAKTFFARLLKPSQRLWSSLKKPFGKQNPDQVIPPTTPVLHFFNLFVRLPLQLCNKTTLGIKLPSASQWCSKNHCSLFFGRSTCCAQKSCEKQGRC